MVGISVQHFGHLFELFAFRLVASHKLFSEIISNFKSNEDELTLEVNDQNMVAKNYLEGSYVDSRFVRSQLSLRYSALSCQSYNNFLKLLKTIYLQTRGIRWLQNYRKHGHHILYARAESIFEFSRSAQRRHVRAF